jgi:uncharacterized protein (UPF0335 family)
MLEENHAELQDVLRDAFEDAVLMGVDETAMRRILIAMVESLESPKRPVATADPAAADPAASGSPAA